MRKTKINMRPLVPFFLLCQLHSFTQQAQTTIGVSAGISKYTLSVSGEKTRQPIDGHGLVTANFPLSRHFDRIGIRPELGISSRHTYAYSSSPGHYLEMRYGLMQMETNLLLTYLLYDSKLKIVPAAGITTGYAFSGRVHTQGSFLVPGSTPGAVDNTSKLDFKTFPYNRFSVGPVAGVSLQFSAGPGSITLDSRYSFFAINTNRCSNCKKDLEHRIGIAAGYLVDIH